MKKLTLELDKLDVESFGTDDKAAELGTVEAASLPTRPLCTGETRTCTVYWCC